MFPCQGYGPEHFNQHIDEGFEYEVEKIRDFIAPNFGCCGLQGGGGGRGRWRSSYQWA